MTDPDGIEEREADTADRYERDIDNADIDSMLGDESRSDLELQAERVMGRWMHSSVDAMQWPERITVYPVEVKL